MDERKSPTGARAHVRRTSRGWRRSTRSFVHIGPPGARTAWCPAHCRRSGSLGRGAGWRLVAVIRLVVARCDVVLTGRESIVELPHEKPGDPQHSNDGQRRDRQPSLRQGEVVRRRRSAPRQAASGARPPRSDDSPPPARSIGHRVLSRDPTRTRTRAALSGHRAHQAVTRLLSPARLGRPLVSGRAGRRRPEPAYRRRRS